MWWRLLMAVMEQQMSSIHFHNKIVKRLKHTLKHHSVSWKELKCHRLSHSVKPTSGQTIGSFLTRGILPWNWNSVFGKPSPKSVHLHPYAPIKCRRRRRHIFRRSGAQTRLQCWRRRTQRRRPDKHPLFIHRAVSSGPVTSSHGVRCVFTGLFWSGGRTPTSLQLIGRGGRSPAASGQWGVVRVGGGIIDQKSLVLVWQWPLEEAGPRAHAHMRALDPAHVQKHATEGPLAALHYAKAPRAHNQSSPGLWWTTAPMRFGEAVKKQLWPTSREWMTPMHVRWWRGDGLPIQPCRYVIWLEF